MSMHYCIIMYSNKNLNRFDGNNLTYLNYKDDCFNNADCDFKLTIVVGLQYNRKYRQ